MADLSVMRLLHREGVLARAFVTPTDDKSGWLLVCVRVNGTLEYMTKARKTDLKLYKSLESAHVDGLRVGFETVTTELRRLSVA